MADCSSLDALLGCARNDFEQGRLEAAEATCQRAVELCAKSPLPHELLFLRGALALERGAARTARASLEPAFELAPSCARTATALGHARLDCGDGRGAEVAYRRALELEPGVADRHADLAAALRAAGERGSAEVACREALELDPAHAAALNQWGVLLEDRACEAQARDAFRAALRSAPHAAALHANLARVLLALGEHAESARHYEQALAAHPECVAWLNGMACALRAAGSSARAAELLERAHALDPSSLAVLRNLICLRFETGAALAALELCERAHATHPRDEALCAWLVQLRSHCCAWSGLGAWVKELDAHTERALREGRRAPETPLDHVARSCDAERNREVARSWARQVRVASPLPRVDPGERRGESRIRVGYCGGDFREHPVAHLIAGVIERHDRARFEVHVLSYGPPDASRIRSRIAASCDRFTELSGLSHAEAAERIRAARIDVLVELTTHTQFGRLEISAQRPAPVQVAYLGFPGSAGAPWFDYILADRCVVPPEDRPSYDEALVWLPHCYQASDARQAVDPAPPSRAELGLPESGGVFSAFHRSSKLDPEVFALWMRILARCPQSVLWLLGGDALAGVLRREAGRLGVDPERLRFAPAWPRERHLGRLRRADLALDTLRYNGHTTTSDALWMGVPVIAAEGRHFASRVSASILRCAGLPELVTRSPAHYEELAVSLMNDAAARASLAGRLVQARSLAPYFDTDACARDLERAYRAIWQRFLEGLPPTDLALPERAATCAEIATRLSP